MKKKDAKQNMIEIENKMFMNAPTISESFPNINSIELKITYTDPDDSNTFERNSSFNSCSKDYFKIKCPYHECINGGINVRNLVIKILNSESKEGKETFVCHGWQDQERINKNQCLLNAIVKVKIKTL